MINQDLIAKLEAWAKLAWPEIIKSDWDNFYSILNLAKQEGEREAGSTDNIKDYDPGLLNDYGGGKIDWWQNYIRSEIERCNGHWRESLDFVPLNPSAQEGKWEAVKCDRCGEGCNVLYGSPCMFPNIPKCVSNPPAQDSEYPDTHLVSSKEKDNILKAEKGYWWCLMCKGRIEHPETHNCDGKLEYRTITTPIPQDFTPLCLLKRAYDELEQLTRNCYYDDDQVIRPCSYLAVLADIGKYLDKNGRRK